MARTGRPRTFDRDSALRVALELFWAQGYETTSLNELRSAMGGLSPTSFYGAFVSKEQLFDEVLSLYRANEGRVTDVLRDETLPPREAIETCFRGSARMQTAAGHPLGCLVVLSAANCTPANDRVVQALRDERQRNHDSMKAQLRRAALIGDLPSDADVEALSGVFNTFLLGLSTAARDGATIGGLDRSIDLIMGVWPES